MTENSLKKISIIFILLSIIINIAAYMYLPTKVGIHVNSSGVTDNYIPKTIYVLATPVIIIAISIFSSIYKYTNKLKTFMLQGVLFLLNIWIIGTQIKI
jgi:uncharacterized membrane protein